MSKILVDTIDTRSGTSNMTIGSSNTSQITLKSGATLTNFPANTPAWRVGATAQDISFNSATKIDYNREHQDTNSAYDTGNKRFTVPTGLGGTYMIGSWFRIGSSTDIEAWSIFPYVNGATVDNTEQLRTAMVQRNYNTIQISGTLELSAADYLEMYTLNADSNAGYGISTSNEGMFWGFKLIGA